MKRSRLVQTALPFPRRGGARKGAGRRRKDGRVGVAGAVHTARPRLDGRTPVHVTLRLRRDVPSLRTQVGMRVVWRVFAAARERLGVRLAQWAVQRDHLHLIVEPASHAALSRGMQGLCVRLAKQLNRALGRRGRVFADRFHGVPLRSPRQTRNALAYVLLNERHHRVGRGERPLYGSRRLLVEPLLRRVDIGANADPGLLARHDRAGDDMAPPRGLEAWGPHRPARGSGRPHAVAQPSTPLGSISVLNTDTQPRGHCEAEVPSTPAGARAWLTQYRRRHTRSTADEPASPTIASTLQFWWNRKSSVSVVLSGFCPGGGVPSA